MSIHELRMAIFPVNDEVYRPALLSIWQWGWDWIVLLSNRLFCYFCSRFRLAQLRVGWTRPKDCGLEELLMEEILHQVRLVVHPHYLQGIDTSFRWCLAGFLSHQQNGENFPRDTLDTWGLQPIEAVKTKRFFVRIIYSLKRNKMEPENDLFEKENHLRNLHFWVPACVFWGCIPLPSCKSVFFP